MPLILLDGGHRRFRSLTVDVILIGLLLRIQYQPGGDP